MTSGEAIAGNVPAAEFAIKDTPKPGWFRIALTALSVGSVVCAVRYLTGRIPSAGFLALLFGLTFAHEWYSIWCRYRQPSA